MADKKGVKMWNIREQIISASNQLRIQITELSIKEKHEIIDNTINKYCRQKNNSWPLWNQFIDSESIQNQRAWLWINKIIQKSKVLLFFNPDDEEAMFMVNSGDIISILEELYSVEFYITDIKTEYLLCFNHHDYLIGCGKAKEWVRDFKHIL